MGVFIKGVEMPKNCENCLFHFEDDVSFEFVHQCLVDNRYIDECDIHQFPYCCPLIPLPSEHGDLIDRDALRTEVMDSDLDHLQRDDWKEVIQIVEDANVIVPAEGRET